MRVTIDSPLTEILTAKSAGQLKRAFGMVTVGDALAHYPRRYLSPGELTPIAQLSDGVEATVVAEVKRVTVREMKSRQYERDPRKKTLVEVVITDGESEALLTFFGGGWFAKDFSAGGRGVFSGKVTWYNDTAQFAHPHYEMFDDDGATDRLSEEFLRRPIPVYPATKSLATMQIRKFIDTILNALVDVPDPIPEAVRTERKLLPARMALELIHRPREDADRRIARYTLAAHEALVMQTALVQQREAIRQIATRPRAAEVGGLCDQFDLHNPFELTPDQVTVGEAISADLVSGTPMSRLVQGEVGSGKTLVALRAMLQVAESGGQSALIAPTEVLAAQHLRSITAMLGPELAPRVAPVLLTGQLPAQLRKRAALAAASGQALIVVGTHALLSEKTSFADLGLVVVDEQHRFGVEQREALRAKGQAPHTLVLTATPIPRTVAMTVFGDLDVSTIRTMPAGRAGIESHVAPLAEKPGWFHRVFDRAAEEIAQGRQVFVVCAAIDATDDAATEAGIFDAPDGDEAGEGTVPKRGPRWGVVQTRDYLRTRESLANARMAMLHGKLPGEEKDSIMQAFSRGEIDLLIATTVIEVGVDVPNASTMIVMEADRFGVSQLHQLRGRVGRGGLPGLCLLLTEAEQGSTARERVEAVAATLDGFELAEVDLQLRGEGDVLGGSQSGLRSSLRVLRVMKDKNLIYAMRDEAESIVAADPELTSHPVLAEALRRRLTGTSRAALAKS